ncbi:MAG: hypothetical protein KAT69_02235 [Candidatus Aminicenantes bacterium]|nr:hypothetical protein [Candidatus Aminicenantes bacterium]
MKEILTKHPTTGEMLRQVALEPKDLAEIDRVMKSHLEWLSMAQDFISGSQHLKTIIPKLYSIHNKIKDLQHFGIPTEIETGE